MEAPPDCPECGSERYWEERGAGVSHPKCPECFHPDCHVCGSTGMHRHHTSYDPEKLMWVCKTCHMKIHHEDGFRDDLLPDMTRTEAEKKFSLTK